MAVPGAVALVGLPLVALPVVALPAPAAGAATPAYNTFSAAATGTALRMGAGAASTLVDPGTASTDAEESSVEGFSGLTLQMKGVGINGDPGTLAGAVLFAGPDCNPSDNSGFGQCLEAGQEAPGLPDSGLESPSGFPFYAEAFYPVPANQTHVVKCGLNKDANPSAKCASANQALYTEALTDPQASGGPASSGYASSTAYSSPQLSGRALVSRSSVHPDAHSDLVSEVESTGTDFTIPGTPIQITGFRAAAQTIATPSGASGSASCTIDMSVNGTPVGPGQAQQALAAAGAAAGLGIEYVPPTAPSVTPTTAGGVEATCYGAVIRIANKASGAETSYEFGQADAVTSPLTESTLSSLDASQGGSGPVDQAATVAAAGGAAPSDGGSGASAPVGSAASPSESLSAAPPPASPSVAPGPAAAPSAGAAGAAGSAGPTQPVANAAISGLDGKLPSRLIRYQGVNATWLGVVSAGALAAILAGVWLLLGVVRSISRGERLHLPGVA